MRAHLGLLTGLVAIGLSHPGLLGKDGAYRAPDPASSWISMDQLSLDGDGKKSLANALVGLACLQGKITPEDRSRALGLAFRVQPGFEPAIVANFKFRYGQPVVALQEFLIPDAVLSTLVPLARQLMQGNEADRELGWAVLHLLVKLPGDVNEAIVLLEKQGRLPDPPWERLYGTAGSTVEAVPAQGFARQSSESAVLVRAKAGNARECCLVRVGAQAKATSSKMAAKVKVAPGSASGVRKGSELAAKYAADLWKNHWPVGQEVTVAADAKATWVPGDELTFGAGFALVLSGLVTGQAYDPRFAVVGRLGLEGGLEPVGGLEEKLRTASMAGLTHVVLSPQMRDDLLDLLVAGNLLSVVPVQVFSAARMAEVASLALAPSERDQSLSQAMRSFDGIARDLGPLPSAQVLRTPAMRARLEQVVELAPNHVSARLLQVVAAEQVPANFSLGGSLRRIQPLVPKVRASKTSETELREILVGVRRGRPRLHPAVWGVADAIGNLAESRYKVAEQKREGGFGARGLNVTNWAAENSKRDAALSDCWTALQSEPEIAAALAKLRAEEG